MTSKADKIFRGEPLTFSLENDLAQLDQLHDLIKNFGIVHELRKKIIFETNLVLEEIFTNIIAYGHGDKNRHPVDFSLECNNYYLIIKVEDDGMPFNLLDADPVAMDTDLEHRSVGGLGIHLIRKYMDDVSYERISSKNVVTMRKNIA